MLPLFVGALSQLSRLSTSSALALLQFQRIHLQANHIFILGFFEDFAIFGQEKKLVDFNLPSNNLQLLPPNQREVLYPPGLLVSYAV